MGSEVLRVTQDELRRELAADLGRGGYVLRPGSNLRQDRYFDKSLVLSRPGLAPGPVRTARFVKQVAANAELWGVSQEEAEKRFTDETPLGYIPTPEDVAGVIVFLASPRAAYMTGTTVTVDGGITHGI